MFSVSGEQIELRYMARKPLHTYLQHIMINLLNLWNTFLWIRFAWAGRTYMPEYNFMYSKTTKNTVFCSVQFDTCLFIKSLLHSILNWKIRISLFMKIAVCGEKRGKKNNNTGYGRCVFCALEKRSENGWGLNRTISTPKCKNWNICGQDWNKRSPQSTERTRRPAPECNPVFCLVCAVLVRIHINLHL